MLRSRNKRLSVLCGYSIKPVSALYERWRNRSRAEHRQDRNRLSRLGEFANRRLDSGRWVENQRLASNTLHWARSDVSPPRLAVQFIEPQSRKRLSIAAEFLSRMRSSRENDFLFSKLADSSNLWDAARIDEPINLSFGRLLQQVRYLERTHYSGFASSRLVRRKARMPLVRIGVDSSRRIPGLTALVVNEMDARCRLGPVFFALRLHDIQHCQRRLLVYEFCGTAAPQ